MGIPPIVQDLISVVTGRVNDEPVFTAEITQVCISTETMRPVAVPDGLRKALLGAAED